MTLANLFATTNGQIYSYGTCRYTHGKRRIYQYKATDFRREINAEYSQKSAQRMTYQHNIIVARMTLPHSLMHTFEPFRAIGSTKMTTRAAMARKRQKPAIIFLTPHHLFNVSKDRRPLSESMYQYRKFRHIFL